jgi:hypothetical protein
MAIISGIPDDEDLEDDWLVATPIFHVVAGRLLILFKGCETSVSFDAYETETLRLLLEKERLT